MPKSIISVFFVLLFSIGNAQFCSTDPTKPYAWRTHQNWFVGNNLIMNSNSFQVDTVGSSFASAYEGRAVASDSSGNLLFFTNGIKLWDNTGTLLKDDLLSGGENSSGQMSSGMQGVLVVKHPKVDEDYYIFTVDDAISGVNGITHGLNYFIYNSSTNSCSEATRLGTFRTTEQLSATLHKNGEDIWVATHESSLEQGGSTSKFYTFLLTENGVDSVPVISDLGFVVKATPGPGGRSNERATLRFSWDGTKAAASFHCGSGTWDPINSIGFMDFNSENGEFTNYRGICPNDVNKTSAKSVLFSKDNSRLFVSYWGAFHGEWLGFIDLDSNFSYHELNSTYKQDYNAGNLKMGPDGNIYFGEFKDQNGWSYGAQIHRIINTSESPQVEIDYKFIGENQVSYSFNNSYIVPSKINSCPQQFVKTRVFYDENKNGIKEIGENWVSGYRVKTDPFVVMGNTDTNGIAFLPISTNDNISFLPVLNDYDTLTTAVLTGNFPLAGDTLDLGLIGVYKKEYVDAEVELSLSGARINVNNYLNIFLSNNGTKTAYDLDVKLNFPAVLIPNDLSGLNQVTDTSFVFTIDSLESINSINEIIEFKVENNVGLIGDDFDVTAEIIYSGDLDLNNNVDTISRIFTGAYDPNIKVPSVGENGTGQNLMSIDYTIHFQNTGNDTAYDVYVLDRIDTTVFDYQNLIVKAASHDYTFIVSETGVLRVDFKNIYLVDSVTNPQGSMGYFKVTLPLKTALMSFDTVYNQAEIYFDANPPIFTKNSKVYYLSNPTGIKSFTKQGLSVYPNPADNYLTIQSEFEFNTLNIVDLSGRIILSEFGGQNIIDVSELKEGVYLLYIDGEGAGKIIINRKR